MAFWGNIGARLGAAAKQALAELERQGAESAAHVVAEAAKDPRVQEALASAGKAVSDPAAKKLTPKIWAAAAAVALLLVVVVVLVRRKAS